MRSKNPLMLIDLELENFTPAQSDRLINLKMCDILTPDGKVPKRVFNNTMNLAVTDSLWEKLDKIRTTAALRYGTGHRRYGLSEPLHDFFMRWKKGSKKVRSFITGLGSNSVPHNMIKYAENTETIIGLETAKQLNKSWNSFCYSNEIRTFLFKFHNNTLPYNTILSHFVQGVSRNCTFCDILLNPDEEDENPLHLFFNCFAVENLREEFFRWLTNDNNFTVSRTEFFTVFRKPNEFLNKALFIVTQLFIKFVWACKIRKILPVQRHLRCNILLEVQLLVKISKKNRDAFANSGLDPEFLNTVLQG
jgi:hypothetical protein